MKKILLFSLALFSVVLTSNAQCACSNKTKAETSVQVTGNGVAYFKAAQIRCGGCANKVKKTLSAVEGVNSVDVDLTTKSIKVSFDQAKTNVDALKDTFHQIGYSSQIYFPENKNIEYATFNASQIRCGGCANKVIKTLRADKGVKDVAVNVETKDVAIAFDKTLTSKEQIIKDFKTIEYIVKEVYSE